MKPVPKKWMDKHYCVCGHAFIVHNAGKCMAKKWLNGKLTTCNCRGTNG